MNAPRFYEEWACPLVRIEQEWNDEGTEQTRTAYPCNATLYVDWSFCWPVPTEDDGHEWTGDEAALNAHTDHWRIVCGEGHVLATDGRGAEDSADAFNMPLVMHAVGAKKVERPL